MRKFGLALCLWALGATAGSAAVLRIDVVGQPLIAELGGLWLLQSPGERLSFPVTDVSSVQGSLVALEAATTFARSTTGFMNIEVGQGNPNALECGGLLASFCGRPFGFGSILSRLQIDFVSGIVDIVDTGTNAGYHSLTNTFYQTVHEQSGLFAVGDELYLGTAYSYIRLQADITSLSVSFVDPTPVPLPASAGLMLAGLGGLVMVRRRRGKGDFQ